MRTVTNHPSAQPPAALLSHSGSVRLGRRTKLLVKELRPGDIAVIEHRDIDRVSAEELIRIGTRCVINVDQSSTGEYPNTGPTLMAEAGIHLVDAIGAPLFDQLKDGQAVAVVGGEISAGGKAIAQGEVQSLEVVAAKYEQAKRGVGQALERFAENTVNHMRAERELLSGKLDFPMVDTRFRDRPALIVVRGVDHEKDLRALRTYIRDEKPVLVGVDGGANAILEQGFQPHMIVGDMDSAQDMVLECGAELLVHAYTDGRAPGRERLDSLGLRYKVVAAAGTSEDIAMLLAAEEGASLIVTVGSHFNLVEFLDKNRKGMSSTFLTRIRIGEILVDAKGVSRLYQPAPRKAPLAAVSIAGMITLIIVIAASPGLSDIFELLWLNLKLLLGFE